MLKIINKNRNEKHCVIAVTGKQNCVLDNILL